MSKNSIHSPLTVCVSINLLSHELVDPSLHPLMVLQVPILECDLPRNISYLVFVLANLGTKTIPEYSRPTVFAGIRDHNHLWIAKICEYLRAPLNTLITAYFNSSNTKYTLICIIKHRGSHLDGLLFLCSLEYSQSVPKNINGASGLVDLQTAANNMSSSIAPKHSCFLRCIFI